MSDRVPPETATPESLRRQASRLEFEARMKEAQKKTCTRCGKSVYVSDAFMEGSEVRLSFGYGSRNDNESWTAWLCDECCDGLNVWANGFQVVTHA